ncbi:MAG: M67 family metallopeptidase [Synergistaceae bacterium]|nr:M67 family metallopeptidase [Synergistaceae bacterium]
MSGGPELRIKKPEYDKIIAHAYSCLPNEACGIIAGSADGRRRCVGAVYALVNTDASGEHFSIDPGEHLKAVRDARSRGLSPIGNFHSHPSTPARPSEEDIRLAYDRSASYLIVSLAGKEPVLRSFRIENGAASPEEIVIE